MSFHKGNITDLHNNRDFSRTDFSYYNDHSLTLMSL